MRENGARGLAGDHRTYDIANGDSFRAFLLGLALSRERVRGLARLADTNYQSAIIDNRVAVPKLAAVIHLDGNPGYAFDHEFAGKAGVPARAACDDFDVAEILKFLFTDVH